MAVIKQRYHAVVMGDLVRSEHAQSIQIMHNSFNSAIDKCNFDHRQQLASPLTITLGDEFQGLTNSMASALYVVRDLRFALMADGVECRFAIGVVALQTPINTSKAWNMMGPGLAKTRDKLNEKRTVSLYRFAVTDDVVIETMLEALGSGLTLIERRWTAQQRQDIIALLAGATPSEVAKARNVSVHSIYKVRGSGDYDSYALHWNAVETTLAHLDKQAGMA